MKKIKKLLFALTILAMLPLGVFAKEKVNVYLFKREGCGYCANALTFFETLSNDAEYQNYFNFIPKDVSDTKNNNLMTKTAKKLGVTELGVTKLGVPFIVIGEEYFEGYSNTYDDAIKEAIKYAYDNESADIVLGNNGDSSAVTIIILLAIVFGVIFLIYMAKDSNTQEEVEEEKEKQVKEESKSKSTETKKTTTTKKKNPSKKDSKTKTTNKNKA